MAFDPDAFLKETESLGGGSETETTTFDPNEFLKIPESEFSNIPKFTTMESESTARNAEIIQPDEPVEKKREEVKDSNIFSQAGNDLMRGLLSAKAIGEAVAGIGFKAIGADTEADAMMKRYLGTMDVAEKQYPAAIGSYKEIKSLGDAGRYAVEAIMENLPMFLPSLVTGGAGAVIARGAAEKVVAGMAAEMAAKNIAKEKIAEEIGKAITKRVALGSTVGAVPSSVGMEAGSIGGDIYKETGKIAVAPSLIGGTAAGFLDAITPIMSVERIFGRAAKEAIKKGIIRRLGEEGAKQFAVEGVTEGAQTVIEQIAQSSSTGKKIFTKELAEQVIDAILKGGIAGGGIGVVTEAAGSAVGPSNVPPAEKSANDILKGLDAVESVEKSVPPSEPIVSPPQPTGTKSLADLGFDAETFWTLPEANRETVRAQLNPAALAEVQAVYDRGVRPAEKPVAQETPTAPTPTTTPAPAAPAKAIKKSDLTVEEFDALPPEIRKAIYEQNDVTGRPGQAAFNRQLKTKTENHTKPVYVAVGDVNGFKSYNDVILDPQRTDVLNAQMFDINQKHLGEDMNSNVHGDEHMAFGDSPEQLSQALSTAGKEIAEKLAIIMPDGTILRPTMSWKIAKVMTPEDVGRINVKQDLGKDEIGFDKSVGKGYTTIKSANVPANELVTREVGERLKNENRVPNAGIGTGTQGEPEGQKPEPGAPAAVGKPGKEAGAQEVVQPPAEPPAAVTPVTPTPVTETPEAPPTPAKQPPKAVKPAISKAPAATPAPIKPANIAVEGYPVAVTENNIIPERVNVRDLAALREKVMAATENLDKATDQELQTAVKDTGRIRSWLGDNDVLARSTKAKEELYLRGFDPGPNGTWVKTDQGAVRRELVNQKVEAKDKRRAAGDRLETPSETDAQAKENLPFSRKDLTLREKGATLLEKARAWLRRHDERILAKNQRTVPERPTQVWESGKTPDEIDAETLARRGDLRELARSMDAAEDEGLGRGNRGEPNVLRMDRERGRDKITELVDSYRQEPGKADTKYSDFVLVETPADVLRAQEILGDVYPVRDIVFVRSQNGDPGFNGVYIGKTLYINADSAKPHIWTMFHEAFHHIQIHYPTLYNEFLSHVRQNMTGEGRAAMMRRAVAENRKKHTSQISYMTDEAIEKEYNSLKDYRKNLGLTEITADLHADEMLSPGFMQYLYDESPVLFREYMKRIINFLTEAINKIRAYFRANHVETSPAWFNDIVETRRELAKMVYAVTQREAQQRSDERSLAKHPRLPGTKGIGLVSRADPTQTAIFNMQTNLLDNLGLKPKTPAKAVEQTALSGTEESQTAKDIERVKRERAEAQAAQDKGVADLPLFNENEAARAAEAQGRLFSRVAPSAQWYYSALSRAFINAPAKLDNLTGTQWKQWLESNKGKIGIKNDEIEWTGIRDFLDLKAKEKVSKAEIAAYLDENGVKVEEVNKTDRNEEARKEYNDYAEWLINKYSKDHPGYNLNRLVGAKIVTDSEYNMLETLREAMDLDRKNGTKFGRWQLPGGQNYRELLLTLPISKRGKPEPVTELTPDYEVTHDSLNKRWGVTPVDQEHGQPIGAWHNNKEDAVAEAIRLINNKRLSDWATDSVKNRFLGGHFSEPNILAHIRMNDRTDADGNKVLFIEELQSDWAQKGRKEGFAQSENAEKYKAFERKMIEKYGVAYEVEMTKEEAIEASRLYDKKNAVPSAPFVTDTKSWLSLALKRIMRYAVDNGYTKVAWTTGAQQAERYDLSKQVDEVEAVKQSNGAYQVNIIKNGEVVIDKVLLENELSDFVGKDLAEKIIKGEGRDPSVPRVQTFKGVDLKVGGEGMNAFYDGIVPQVANEILKKVGGGKVEDYDLGISSGKESFGGDTAYMSAARDIKKNGISKSEALVRMESAYKNANKAELSMAVDLVYGDETKQHSFAITPAMAEKVSEGLPLFSRAEPGEPSVGRPDLANPGITKEVRDIVDAVDEARNQVGEPEVRPDPVVRAEAERRFAANPNLERTNIFDKVKAGGMLDDVETIIAHHLINRDGMRAISSGDPKDMAAVGRLVWAYRQSGTNQARAFRQRRDRMMSPEERMNAAMQMVITPPLEIRDAIQRFYEIGKPESANNLMDAYSKKARETLLKLKAQGYDFSDPSLAQRLVDPVEMAKLLNAISATKGVKIGDILSEYWINSILSGPLTHIANITGNLISTGHEFTVQRAAEALVNLIPGIHTKDAATFGEMKRVYRAMLRTLPTAWKNAIRSFKAETDIFEYEVTGRAREGRLEEGKAAISGLKGRVIRTPGRSLAAADSFFKTIIANAQVAAIAYRKGKAAGLTGKQMEAYIGQEILDTGSRSWQTALEYAKELTFQKDLQGIGQKVQNIRNYTLPGGIKPLAFIFPFVRTPWNIFATGLRKSPLGSLSLAANLTRKGFRKFAQKEDGTWDYTREQAVKHIAEQLIAWGALVALVAAAGPDDDDKDRRPRITGTKTAFSGEKGKRDFEQRTNPPMSIRLGNKWYSYARLEPIATTLAAMVDLINNARGPEPIPEKILNQAKGIMNQTRDKTFLQGMTDLMNAWEDPERFASRWAQNFATSWVPNLIRAPLRTAQTNIPEMYPMPKEPEEGSVGIWTRRLGAGWLPVESVQPPPKVDVWGREIRRSPVNNTVGRVVLGNFVPSQIRKDEPMAADLWLVRYNEANPDNQWWPTTPRKFIMDGGKRINLTEREYHDYVQNSGKKTAEWAAATDFLNREPTVQNMEILERTLREARAVERRKILRARRALKEAAK